MTRDENFFSLIIGKMQRIFPYEFPERKKLISLSKSCGASGKRFQFSSFYLIALNFRPFRKSLWLSRFANEFSSALTSIIACQFSNTSVLNFALSFNRKANAALLH